MDHIEEIKLRLPIEELVGEYVSLNKAGRNLKGLCPFHNDTKPSLLVNPEKGIAWCFACQNGGDIFSFLQKIENIDFQEAVKILADKTGVTLKNYQTVKKDKNLKQDIENILAEVQIFYENEFKKSSPAQKYWNLRMINNEITNFFGIGYAPNSFDKTNQYLKKKGYSSNLLIKSGLCSQKEKNNDIFDRFRDRIMIPLQNHMGKTIAYAGRIIDNKDKEAKYINSPESIIYNKSKILFGLNHAKEHIKKEGFVVILEGYLDVISSFQANVKNVVAVSGTALTKDHLKLLKRYTNFIKLCFDDDSAGIEATKRSIEILAQEDFNVEIIQINDAKDADELIKNDADKWRESLKNSISSMDFLFAVTKNNFNLTDTQAKKAFTTEIMQYIKLFSSKVLQHDYLKKLAEICDIKLGLLLDEFKTTPKKINPKKTEISLTATTEKKNQINAEKYLLGLLLMNPSFFSILKKSIIFQVFTDEETKHIYKNLLENYNEPEDTSLTKFFADQKEKALVWQMYAEEKNDNMDTEMLTSEFQRVLNSINIKNLEREKEKLVKQINKDAISKTEQSEYALKIIEINKLRAVIT